MVPATGLRGRYFLPMTTGASKVASHMIDCAAAGTNYNTATSFVICVVGKVWCSGTAKTDECRVCVAVTLTRGLGLETSPQAVLFGNQGLSSHSV